MAFSGKMGPQVIQSPAAVGSQIYPWSLDLGYNTAPDITMASGGSAGLSHQYGP